MTVRFSRCFAMPSAETFSVKPIGEFVQRFLADSEVSVDPFARNRDWATYTNDINPSTSAQSHQDAEAFLLDLAQRGIAADLALFDPPYSPRQVAEHYKAAGKAVTGEDTQNGRLYRRVRDALDRVMAPGGIVLSFGWQSVGMGVNRGYELFETMLVAHGGGHNDTICIAERKFPPPESAWSHIDRELSSYVQVVRANAFEECAKIAEQTPKTHRERCIADPDAVRRNAADRIRSALSPQESGQ